MAREPDGARVRDAPRRADDGVEDDGDPDERRKAVRSRAAGRQGSMANVATTGAWSLVPTSRNAGHDTAAAATDSLART